MKQLYYFLFGAGMFCNFQFIFSQDIHFSQFYQVPLHLNPALTGVFNGDIRASINYKDQWRSINDNTNKATYQTSSFSFDAGVFKKKWKNSYLGTGLFVYSDKAGDSKMGTTQINFSVSSIVLIAEGHQVSAGVQGGYAQRSVNTDNPDLRWDEQFVNEVYNSTLPSGETVTYEPFSYPDFSAGASWNYGSEETAIFKNNKFSANAGIAYHHLNRPTLQFNGAENLYSKIVAHGGSYIGLSNTALAILPSFFYFQQGPTRETNFGTMVRYTLKEESKYSGIIKESAVYLGGYIRMKDAIIPSVMIDFANFTLGITYDINVSRLNAATDSKGGIEFSLRFINPNPFTYKYGRGRSKSVRFL